MRFLIVLTVVAFSLFIFSPCLSQTATLVDVEYKQSIGVITLRYKLDGVDANQFVAVRVTALQNGKQYKVRSAKGNIGMGVPPYGIKTITWNAFEDNIQKFDGINFNFEVVTLPGRYRFEGDRLSSVKRMNSLLIPCGVGLGLTVTSGILYSESRKIYDIYKSNLNPNSETYSETSRDGYYIQANRKYLISQVVALTGVSVIAGSMIYYKINKERQKKWKTIKKWSLKPEVMFSPTQGTMSYLPSGFSLKYQF